MCVMFLAGVLSRLGLKSASNPHTNCSFLVSLLKGFHVVILSPALELAAGEDFSRYLCCGTQAGLALTSAEQPSYSQLEPDVPILFSSFPHQRLCSVECNSCFCTYPCCKPDSQILVARIF